MKIVKVFVYGTLKTGGVFNHRLLRHEGKSLGFCVLKNTKFVLVEGGSFPFAVNCNDDQLSQLFNSGVRPAIVGELFNVKESGIKDLDVLEGYPRMYNRKELTVTTVSHEGDEVDHVAWMYYRNQGLITGEDVCAHGVWWPRTEYVRVTRQIHTPQKVRG